MRRSLEGRYAIAKSGVYLLWSTRKQLHEAELLAISPPSSPFIDNQDIGTRNVDGTTAHPFSIKGNRINHLQGRSNSPFKGYLIN